MPFTYPFFLIIMKLQAKTPGCEGQMRYTDDNGALLIYANWWFVSVSLITIVPICFAVVITGSIKPTSGVRQRLRVVIKLFSIKKNFNYVRFFCFLKMQVVLL